MSSRTLASAAALGSKTSPARDTGTAEVGTLSVAGADTVGVGDGVGVLWTGPRATAVVLGVEIDAGAGAGAGAFEAGTADEVGAGAATPPFPKVKD